MSVPFWLTISQASWTSASWGAKPRERTALRIVARRGDTSLDASETLTVEFADLATAESERAGWSALLERALEPNIFMEPAFVLATAQHVAEAQRPTFLLVRSEATGELLGVWAIEARTPLLSRGFVLSHCGPNAVLGTPIIDRTRAADVVDAVLAAIATKFGPQTMLLVPYLLRAGPTYGLLVSRAMATGRASGGLSPHARAILTAGDVIEPKRRKDFARQRRRLEELGQVTFRSAVTPDEIRADTERFFCLESSGWKGRRATALLSDPGTVTFARSMIRQFAKTGQCRIDCLELDGQPIAMGIVLRSGNRAYFWKTAFDELFASLSPGVLLTLELSRRQQEDPRLLLTDSCAVAGHPMIERLWRGRQDMVDLAVAASPAANVFASGALRRETLRRQARTWAKDTVHSLMSRRRLPAAAALQKPDGRATSTR